MACLSMYEAAVDPPLRGVHPMGIPCGGLNRDLPDGARAVLYAVWMPLTRWIISCRKNEATEVKDAVVNTLYFNVSKPTGEDVGWDTLGNDLWTLWSTKPWAVARFLDVRGYNMDDSEPREPQFMKRQLTPGSSTAAGPNQVALCLSYYADRNLPRKRGRIYIGPFATPGVNASPQNVISVMTLPPALAALGGLDVDWSLWSPTTQTHTRINHAWCDDSWDIIRSRKLPPSVPRTLWEGNG